MAHWLALEEVCRRLGVRPQTVYAYVSRGRLEASPDPVDTRRSLYRAEDVAGLARRKEAGRKRETLAAGTLFGDDPSIPTALSAFARGRPHYRGRDAVALAATADVETAARLIWDTPDPVDFTCEDAERPSRPGRAAAFVLLAERAAAGLSTRGRQPRALHREAQALIGALATAFGAAPGRQALHLRFARGWRQPAAAADLLRTAMVLLLDHELTSSAFATRVAASTGSSLPSCLLAGLATLSGPLHGDASGQVRALFAEVERAGGEAVLAQRLAAGAPLPGFGHHLYPDGDPRAAALLARFAPPEPLARFLRQAVDATGLPPNVDFALAALALQLRLPADAAFGLFATARCVGLLAHALEQLGTAQVIRPRGRYVGIVPEAAANG